MFSFIVETLEAIFTVIAGLIVSVEAATSMVVFIQMDNDEIFFLLIVRTKCHSFTVSPDINTDETVIGKDGLKLLEFFGAYEQSSGTPACRVRRYAACCCGLSLVPLFVLVGWVRVPWWAG